MTRSKIAFIAGLIQLFSLLSAQSLFASSIKGEIHCFQNDIDWMPFHFYFEISDFEVSHARAHVDDGRMAVEFPLYGYIKKGLSWSEFQNYYSEMPNVEDQFEAMEAYRLVFEIEGEEGPLKFVFSFPNRDFSSFESIGELVDGIGRGYFLRPLTEKMNVEALGYVSQIDQVMLLRSVDLTNAIFAFTKTNFFEVQTELYPHHEIFVDMRKFDFFNMDSFSEALFDREVQAERLKHTSRCQVSYQY